MDFKKTRKLIFFILLLLFNNIFNFYCKDKNNLVINEKYSLQIPNNWQYREESNNYFYILNYSEEYAEKIQPQFDKNWRKIEFFYRTQLNSSLEKELEIKLKDYSSIIIKEKIKLTNGKYIYLIVSNDVPDITILNIIYYDNFKILLINSIPGDIKFKENLLKLINSFKFKYIRSKVNSLRLRNDQSTESIVIRTISINEILEIIEKGNQETINGIKGTWVKVMTEKGEIGWCFDGYLEEVK